MKLLAIIALVALLALSYFYFRAAAKPTFERLRLHSLDELVNLFPSSKAAIERNVDQAIARASKQLDYIYSIDPQKRTFANTMRAFDVTTNRFLIVPAALAALSQASPNDEVRNAAHETLVRLQAFSIDHFTLNPRLYAACEEYEKLLAGSCEEPLNDEQRYFVQETMRDFRRNGLQLPVDVQEKIRKVQKELAQHSLAFDKNINDSQRTIEVGRADLKGLDEHFIDSLKKTEKGTFIIGTDYPTNTKLLEECEVTETRKAQYRSFMQRAYPENVQELTTVIRLRDELAHLLGFESYAQFDLDNQMAKSPDRVKQFLTEVFERGTIKNDEEMELLKKDLPLSVILTSDGKFYPWDLQFVRNYYKKKHLAIDENFISEFFPVEYVLPALFSIYEKFFGLSFKPYDATLWHKDVKVLAVYKNGYYKGCLLLDLYPRPFKYSHAGQLTIIPALCEQGEARPAVALVLANFPQAQSDRPALLKRFDVITFFHEAGHAIHALLGATQMAGFSGTNTKGDFVEMPSQMLEEWMWDPQILKMVSSHYKTKQPMPDELIEKIVALKNFESGENCVRQVLYATVCLDYYGAGAHRLGADKDVDRLWRDLHEKMRPSVLFDKDNKGYCAFTHLMGYGAKYYGYLWSKVYALDLFYYIKPFGLLNSTIGDRYIHDVIGMGGSKDPELLLEKFLGRKPNSDAFFKDLGLV